MEDTAVDLCVAEASPTATWVILCLCSALMSGCFSTRDPRPILAPHLKVENSRDVTVAPNSVAENSPSTGPAMKSRPKKTRDVPKRSKVVSTSPPSKQVLNVASSASTSAPAPIALDLASLESRLQQTKAIGFLSKLALKNQVEDLLAQFRAYYSGSLRTNLAQLRRRYDLLLMKVLALLQDGDQALAAAIGTSREAVWAILSDRKKFATL